MSSNLLDQLPHMTTRIEALMSGGQRSLGTAYFFDFEYPPRGSIPVLVTNKHVLQDAIKITITLSFGDSNGDAPLVGKFREIEIDQHKEYVVEHPNSGVDLAVILIAPTLKKMDGQNLAPFYRSLSAEHIPNLTQIESLTAIEDILMVGYPTGIWDEANNLPVVRRGITATPYARDFGNRAEFLIDCACFPGSSGSPVVIATEGAHMAKDGRMRVGGRFFLLGTLFAGPMFNTEGNIVSMPVQTSAAQVSISQIPMNLGYCVKSRMLRDLAPLVLNLRS